MRINPQVIVRFVLVYATTLFSQETTLAQDNSLFTTSQRFQTMGQRWELDSNTKKGTFIITPYKPVYVTMGRFSTNPNMQPTSENPAYSLPFKINYNKYEAQFHISFKTKVIQGLFNGHGDIWVAYTQKAHWQVYNEALSRPFRELNYEPEVILNFATRYKLFGFTGRMFGVAFNHQSNGRTLPLSRSWNRVIFHAGFERKDWQVMLRPWIRLKDEEDENPSITNFVGKGELLVVRNFKKHQFSFVGTHSLHTGDKSHGSMQLAWVFVIVKNFKGRVQFTDGYGETLQDYNHRQTTCGLAVSLTEW